MDNNQNTTRTDVSMGQFIDPMFAVIIAAAVTETVVVWVKQDNFNVEWFELSVVLVGFINLLMSWFGYHKSVTRKPIKGGLRFVITVTLLPLYLFTIILSDKPFHFIVITYFIIFVLWTIWEYFKAIEYNAKKKFKKLLFRKINVSVYIATIAYLIITQLHSKTKLHFVWQPDNFKWVVLTIISIAIISLRITKSGRDEKDPISQIKNGIHILCYGRPKTEAE